jgi:xylitol oxidase
VTITNWAGNVVFAASSLLRPRSEDELRVLVARNPKIRVVGAGHSFSAVADSAGALVTLDDMPREIEIDSARSTVKVSASIRYADLAPRLQAHGFALANLASLPHVTVAGATATGTHGSGDGNGSLATAVAGIDLVTAGGDHVRVPAGEVNAAAVGMGTFGIMTGLTLRLVPSFAVRQWVYDGLPRAALTEDFDAIFASAYSVSAFTTWRDLGIFDQLWLKRVSPEQAGDHPDGAAPNVWHGARLAGRQRHPVPGMPTEFTTAQGGVAGPWHDRLPHFRAEFTPSAGDELQSEYLLPRDAAVPALASLDDLAPRIAELVLVSEIRTIAADELWLSPAYERDTVAFHFTWRNDPVAVARLLPDIEDRLAPFRPRPHWGKLFTLPAARVRDVYPRIADFTRLANTYDPGGKFRNDFLTGILEA